MINNYISEKDGETFSYVVNKMREFFLSRGFIEVHTQDRLSILAACEDPDTVATFNYNGDVWPLPQTGQMWLEYELLSKPERPGVFCVSTSYRAEPNPVPGRHKIVFPMFEFEAKGDMEELKQMEIDLLEHLGFDKSTFVTKSYDELKEYYGVHELEHEHENAMRNDLSEVVLIDKFPIETSPFWNMRKIDDNYSYKVDVIVGGQETIGSAERASDVEEMRKEFQTISEGGYAKKLYDLFGKERVNKELEEYLTLDFFPRFGGGIGVSRLIKAMKENNLIGKNN